MIHSLLKKMHKNHQANHRKKTALPHFIWRDPLHFIACGFGTGAIPMAPGTFGTLIAVPIYYGMSFLPLPLYTALLLLFIVFASWISERASKAIGIHDHSGVNCDEIVGFLLTMIAIPPTPLNILLGFTLFRLFDIWKPWPIQLMDQRLLGGFGMIADDLAAAGYAWISLQIILWITTRSG